jgi:hypothetical protein
VRRSRAGRSDQTLRADPNARAPKGVLSIQENPMTTRKPAKKPNAKPTKKTSEKAAKRTVEKVTKNPKTGSPKPLYVVFGLDADEKPRAARFINPNEKLVAKLAQSLGLRVGITTTTAHVNILGNLPTGRINAQGSEAVPIVGLEEYERINALVGGETGRISTAFPKSWDEIAPGHLVVANDNLEDGWWLALVIKRHENNLTLQWRDYPSQGQFIKNVSDVALLNPNQD